MMKKITLVLIILGISSVILAQSPQFSQFYANPLYHNPAFTGDASTTRLIATTRYQWLGYGSGYNSQTFSVDSYLGAKNSIGFQAIHDNQFQFLKTESLAGFYSRFVPLNETTGLTLGTKIGWTFSRFDNLSNLNFADAFSATSGLISISPTSRDKTDFGSIPINWNYPDVAFGALLKTSETLDDFPLTWLGFSANYRQLMGENTKATFVPRWKLGMQLGYKVSHNLQIWDRALGRDADREKSISFTSHLRKEARFWQLDFGVNLTYTPLVLGVWYRNIPFRKFDKISQQDALTFLGGFQFGKFLVEYSYDVTVSSLYNSSAGAHEISIWYGIDAFLDFRSKKREHRRRLDCTNF